MGAKTWSELFAYYSPQLCKEFKYRKGFMTSSHITKTFANLENFSAAHFLWNSLASDIDLSLPALSIKRHIVKIFWNHFLTNFHLDNSPVYFHYLLANPTSRTNSYTSLLGITTSMVFVPQQSFCISPSGFIFFLLNGFHCWKRNKGTTPEEPKKLTFLAAHKNASQAICYTSASHRATQYPRKGQLEPISVRLPTRCN